MSKTNEEATMPTLPAGVIKSDLAPPKNWRLRARRKTGGEGYEEAIIIDLWYTERFGWCITTLPIGTNRRVSQSYSSGQRTYGIAVKGEGVVTIGNGPHIKARCTVHVKTSRLAKLQHLVDLHDKGLEKAHEIRDQRGSRRAAGIARRNRW